MRGSKAAVLLITACASSSAGPDAAPPPPDADLPDAYVMPDAAPPPDGEPLGPGVLLDDAPGDFAGTGFESTVVSAWGAVEPVAWLTGGLLARASDTGVFTSGPAATWADVTAMTLTGTESVAMTLDRNWVATVPAGLGLADGDDWTIALEGEIFLDSGFWQLHLLVDDHGFVELAPQASQSFVRVASADWAAEGSGGFTATGAGWYPIRIAICEQTVNAEWHLQATPPASGRAPIPRHRLRFRADGLDGMLQSAFDDSYLVGSHETTIDDDSPADRDWTTGAPADLGLTDADHFSVRWAGQVRIDAPGDYSFRLTSDDGQRLWLDGQELLSAWDETTHDDVTAAVTLDAGWHDLVIDHMEIGGGARATLIVESGPQGAGAPLPVASLRPVVSRRERYETAVDRADRAIPDLGTVDVVIPIDAPAGAKVDGIDVSWTFTHSYHGDLEIRLIAPDASTVLLRDNLGGSASGAVTERLHVTGLDDAGAAGNFILRVTDTASLDAGTLLDVQLTVHHGAGQPPIPAAAAYDSDVIDLGNGVTAWETLTWGARAVAGSSIRLRARAGDDEGAVAASTWSTPMVDPTGSVPPMPPARWFQYRIEFTSDGDAAPAVDFVRLDYTVEEQ